MRALVASVLIVTACSSPGPTPAPDPADGDGPGRLVLELATPEEIRGSFQRTDLQVRFHGTRTAERATLTVLTGAGNELFAIEGTAHGSLVRMNGEDFARSGAGVIAYSAGDAGTYDAGMPDAGMPDGGMPDAGGDDAGTQQCTAGSAQSGETYAAFISAPETALLPWLSAALGERGYDGRRYPSTMALHKLAMRVSRDTDITPPAAIAAGADTACTAGSGDGSGSGSGEGSGEGSGSGSGSGCADLSGDPNGDSCYGMCGNGCNCWRWVCGDCCCNAGCRQHDAHCRACRADPLRNKWACVQCACFDWGNPLFDCTKCS
jgi:hypothetical protein